MRLNILIVFFLVVSDFSKRCYTATQYDKEKANRIIMSRRFIDFEPAAQESSETEEKAMRAAKVAEAAAAALAGKEQLIKRLEKEVREAEAEVKAQNESVQTAQTNLEDAMQAVYDAQSELKNIVQAVQAGSEIDPLSRFPMGSYNREYRKVYSNENV